MNARLSSLLVKLDFRKINYRLIKMSGRAISVDDVILLSNGDIKKEQICKTIIVKGASTFYGFFLEGSKKIDFEKSEFGEKLKIAPASDVRAVAGVEPGAVCPLLIDVPVIVDEMVLQHEKVNFGSGDHRYGIEMAPSDVVSFCNASIKKISKN